MAHVPWTDGPRAWMGFVTNSNGREIVNMGKFCVDVWPSLAMRPVLPLAALLMGSYHSTHFLASCQFYMPALYESYPLWTILYHVYRGDEREEGIGQY